MRFAQARVNLFAKFFVTLSKLPFVQKYMFKRFGISIYHCADGWAEVYSCDKMVLCTSPETAVFDATVMAFSEFKFVQALVL